MGALVTQAQCAAPCGIRLKCGWSSSQKKKEEKMVRITAESGENTRTIEGKAAIVYVMDPEEGGDHATLALDTRIKRLDLLTGGGACNRKPGCRII